MTLPPAGVPVSASRVEIARLMTQLDANPLGNVHGGVIMREVDNAGGMAAARHAGRICVTAAIDQLSFMAPVHVKDLLILRASVNFAGATSLEVGVRVEAEPFGGGPRRHTTSAFLVFVSLDEHGKPSPVPPLIAETPDELRRQELGALRRQMRDERRQRIGAWPQRDSQ